MVMLYSDLRGFYLPNSPAHTEAAVFTISNGTADVSADVIMFAPSTYKKLAPTLPFSYGYYGYYLREEGKRTSGEMLAESLVDDNFLFHIFSPFLYCLIGASALLYAVSYFLIIDRSLVHGVWHAFAVIVREPQRQSTHLVSALVELYHQLCSDPRCLVAVVRVLPRPGALHGASSGSYRA